ncbi:MAG: tyrosine-type recombinase/integrase [Gemmatimonadetes bacterium]|nr:tyrosine-type recombinase/integrase [Gemmatimonadota bacterium]
MPKKRKRSKLWSFAEGDRGHTVTVFERERDGPLYARAFDQSLRNGRGGYRRISLGHRDRDRAEVYALEQAAKLREGQAEIATGKTTLARLFALYETHRTPRKSRGEQVEDARRIGMWTRQLGARKDPHRITLGEWEGFTGGRSSGAIDAHGKPVPTTKRKPVRARTVERDCEWLGWVLNWGAKWRDREGRYLLRENPIRGFDVPSEKNPRRPVATQDRYEAVRAVSDRITMEHRWDGKRRTVRSYLSEILDIVNGTGRRITAVCSLRYQDLRLDQALHGAILWPADTDKTGRETLVPISPTVRAAIDRVLEERPGIGGAVLFPSPISPDQPIRYELASDWLMKAEKLAEVPKQRGSLWHAYRRKWATERKHLPDVDVAAAGGWTETDSLKQCYQQADEATMLQVVLSGGQLRESKG